MLSNDLREMLDQSGHPIGPLDEKFKSLQISVRDIIPRIEEMERLLNEWMSVEPPDKYDNRAIRTQKVLEAKR